MIGLYYFVLYFIFVSRIDPGLIPEPGSGTCRLVPIRFLIYVLTEGINCGFDTIFPCHFNVDNACNLFNIHPLTGTRADRFKSVLLADPKTGPGSVTIFLVCRHLNAQSLTGTSADGFKPVLGFNCHFNVQSLTGTSADRFKSVPWFNPESCPESGSRNTLYRYFITNHGCRRFNFRSLTGTSADSFIYVPCANSGFGPKTESRNTFLCYFNSEDVWNQLNVRSLTGTSADRLKSVPTVNSGSEPIITFSCHFNAGDVCNQFNVQSLTGTSEYRIITLPRANSGSGPMPGSGTFRLTRICYRNNAIVQSQNFGFQFPKLGTL